ncbi:MAG: hypothetical protein PVG66_04710 [Chromatiales bacterium]
MKKRILCLAHNRTQSLPESLMVGCELLLSLSGCGCCFDPAHQTTIFAAWQKTNFYQLENFSAVDKRGQKSRHCHEHLKRTTTVTASPRSQQSCMQQARLSNIA